MTQWWEKIRWWGKFLLPHFKADNRAYTTYRRLFMSLLRWKLCAQSSTWGISISIQYVAVPLWLFGYLCWCFHLPLCENCSTVKIWNWKLLCAESTTWATMQPFKSPWRCWPEHLSWPGGVDYLNQSSIIYTEVCHNDINTFRAHNWHQC